MTKENFYPLTYTREVADLRCGAKTLAEHTERKPEYIWDLIVSLKEDLERDVRSMELGVRRKGNVHSSAVIYNQDDVVIEEGAEIEACAVLDARSGPIYIGKNTIIRPQSYLKGPLYIGPECRIGGEVTHSIFHGYSNKAHYGFIGHSYIGEWVNLGAGTTCSNLKNNYGTVKIVGSRELGIGSQKEIDTKQQFIGCFVGDYAKTGIGTLINTGSVIGVGANVWGGGLTPKYVPNFAWGSEGRVEIEKFIGAVRTAMLRRGKKISIEEEASIRKLYKLN